jgi:hypothetical protein
MPKAPPTPKGRWIITANAAEFLGISPRRLRELRGELKLGQHYLIVSKRSAVRPTYVWDVETIRQFLGKPLERR